MLGSGSVDGRATDREPVVRQGLVVRPQLVEALDGDTRPITVLVAPSGYGKTTTVRSWLSRQVSGADLSTVGDSRVLWIALSSAIAERHEFWSFVLSAARRLQLVHEVEADELGDDIVAHDDPVLPIVRFLVGRSPVILVIDAFEKLRGAMGQVGDDIVRLVEQVPQTRVIVTSRAATGLEHPHRLLRHQVLVLGTEELGFTPAETAAAIRVDSPAASSQLIDRIHQDTRGYPLAVRATGLSLARRGGVPPRDSRQWLTDVAADLGAQLADSDLHEFVLDTCLTPYFDLDLAIELAGSHAAERLEVLGQEGFGRWIPFAPGRQVFQYVDSVRDAFEELARTIPTRHAKNARLAASWLHRHDELEAALALAVDGQHYDLATQIFRSIVLKRPESYTTDYLAVTLSRVPREAVSRYPLLAFAYGLALLTTVATRGSATEFLEVSARRGTDEVPDLPRPAGALHHAMKVVSLRLVGRYAESAAAAHRALDFITALDLGEQAARVELVSNAVRHLAYSLLQNGEVDDAREVITWGISRTRHAWSRNYALAIGLGIHGFDGRGPEALATLRMIEPASWPRDHEHSYLNGMGIVGRGALHLDAFEFEEALALFTGGEPYSDTAEFWPFFQWTTMHARLGLGDAAVEAHRVDRALRARPIPPGVGDNLGTAALRGTLAILWHAAGKPERAAEAIRPVTACRAQVAPALLLGRLLVDQTAEAIAMVPELEAASGHTVRSLAATRMLAAAAALRTGSRPTALQLLERAAVLHADHGVRAHLLYVPQPDLVALRDLAEASSSPLLVSALEADLPMVDYTIRGAPQLTPRELVVLDALLRHRLRADVAAELHVSVNTVKTQISSLYRKLGVRSRSELLERALETDLLDHEGSRAVRLPPRH